MDGAYSTRGRDEKCIQNCGRKPEGRDHSEVLRVVGKLILKWTLEELGENVWTECIWLRIGTSDGPL
jgi:hypothetical protein